MSRYKGIVIGCGKIGVQLEGSDGRVRPRSHASALVAHKKTELSAFVDTEVVRLEDAKKFFPDVPVFTDLDTCIREIHPDIAVIAASSQTHADIAEKCINAKVPMIIGEKPVAIDLVEARTMQEILKSSSSTFVLNYQRRFFPLFEKAREEIKRGRMGRIHQVTCYYDNGLYNNGGHAIDAVLYLLGERISHVIGSINIPNTTHPIGDENIDGEAVTESGTTITLQSFDQKYYGIHELRLYGEKGALIIRDYGYAVDYIPLLPSAINGTLLLSSAAAQTETDERSMTADSLDEVIICYETGRRPRSGIDNGIETFAVLEALKESARTGGTKISVVYTATV